MAKKDDAGDEDLEGLQLSINEKSDETLECTRRMREMCAEAKDSAALPSLAYSFEHRRKRSRRHIL